LLKVKVKVSCYRPGLAQRVGRGTALLFHNHGTRKRVSGQQHVPAGLYPRRRPGTNFKYIVLGVYKSKRNNIP